MAAALLNEPGGELPAWAVGFTPWTWAHGAMVVLCAALAAGWITLGYVSRRGPRERIVRAVGAGAMLQTQLLMQLYWLSPGRWDPAESLPLHTCDLGAWLAPLALLGGWRWLRVIVCFWGLGFATQAFVQPTLEDGPASMQYYFYFFNHGVMIAAALYEIVVRGLRPRFAEAWFAVGASFAYIAAVLPLNAAFGWNYTFTGRTIPEQPTVIDRLGPWPLRVVWIVLIGTSLFMVIWAAIRVLGGRERDAARESLDSMP